MNTMSIRYATDTEIANWDSLVQDNPGGGAILQGRAFIRLKQKAGWKARFVIADTHAVAFIEKSIPLLGKIWYCPKGPNVTSVADLRSLLSALTPFAKSEGVFSIKIEPELDHTADLSRLSLRKTSPVQYNYATVLVDLSPPLNDILKAFPQKGRHAIRRAERDGVSVKAVPITDKNCRVMYNLFKETADDANFVIRSPQYYKDFYSAYGSNGQLFFAYYEGQVVAGAFATVQGKKSMYKDGASVRERKAYGTSHLLQWHVLQWAKEKGAKEHDLAGVPPIAEIHNPNHPFYGLGRFKTSFNKTVTEYCGAYEVPVQPLRSLLWQKYIEKLVRKLYFIRHHESYY